MPDKVHSTSNRDSQVESNDPTDDIETETSPQFKVQTQ